MFHATQCHVARGDLQNEKMSSNHFPGKAEVKRRSRFENRGAIHLWRGKFLYYFLL